MKNLTFLCSALLIITGLVGYFAWEAIGATKQSFTSLIPTFVGALMLIGGLIALKKNMLGMHDFAEAAPKLILVMTVICLFYTIKAVRSFIAARRARG
jgi:uncharacterized membrane protein (UPF0136 family)